MDTLGEVIGRENEEWFVSVSEGLLALDRGTAGPVQGQYMRVTGTLWWGATGSRPEL